MLPARSSSWIVSRVVQVGASTPPQAIPALTAALRVTLRTRSPSSSELSRIGMLTVRDSAPAGKLTTWFTVV